MIKLIIGKSEWQKTIYKCSKMSQLKQIVENEKRKEKMI